MTANTRQGSLIRRVVLVTIPLWVLLAVTALLAVAGILAVEGAIQELRQRTVEVVHHTGSFNMNINRAVAEALAFAQVKGDQERDEALEALEEAETSLAAIERLLAQEASYDTDREEDGELLQRQRALLSNVRQGVTDLIGAVESDDSAGAVRAFNTLNGLEDELEALSEEAHGDVAEDLAGLTGSVNQLVQRGIFGMAGAVVLAVAVLLLALLALRRYIARPIRDLSIAADSVAAGELESVVRVTSTDEIGVLQNAFNQMVSSLREQRTTLQERNRELETSLRTQDELLETVKELSIPLIPLLEGVVVLPLIGHVDSRRARHIQQTLLQGVSQQRARVAILDITGVKAMDREVMAQLLQAMQGLQLLGAQPILSGMSADVAHLLVAQEVSLENLQTYRDVRSAIEATFAGSL